MPAKRFGLFIIISLLILISAGLRLWRLGGEAVYCDEMASLQHIHAPSLMEFLRLERRSDPPMSPVYFILEYCWGRVVGGSFYGTRLLSLAFGLASIPLLFWLTRMLYGTFGGLVAAGCLGLSVGHIYFSQEVRPYALILFLALVSNISLWKALGGAKPRWWVLNFAANACLLFTHLFTVLFVFSQFVYLFFHGLSKKRRRPFLLWSVSHLPLAVPYVLWYLSIEKDQLELAALWRHQIVHSYLEPLGDLLLFAGAGVPTFRDLPLAGGINIGGIAWRLFLAALMLNAALTFHHWRRNRKGPAAAFVFLATLLAVPSATLFLVSALLYTCHSCRYVIFGMIPFLALVGGSVAMAPGRPAKGLLAAVLCCFYLANLYAHPKPWRPDIAAAAESIDSRLDARAGRMIVLHGADAPTLAFNGHPRLAGLETRCVNLIKDIPGIIPVSDPAAPPTWMVIFLHQLQPPALVPVEQDLERKGWRFTRKMFGYTNPIYVYELQCDRGPQSVSTL